MFLMICFKQNCLERMQFMLQKIFSYKRLIMLLPYLKVLNNKKIILGSQSKTRNQLMQSQRINYKIIPSKFEENLDKLSFASPSDYNLETCKGKVAELVNRFKAEKIEWDILICGDTIVENKGVIIEKPENQKHCIEMVQQLSGTTHRIYTANIVVFNSEPQIKYQWVQRAEVTFGDIDLQIIKEFAKEPEPYLHSGGYEITALSGSFITSINGSFHTVQGLDMHGVCSKMIEGSKKLGWI